MSRSARWGNPWRAAHTGLHIGVGRGLSYKDVVRAAVQWLAVGLCDEPASQVA